MNIPIPSDPPRDSHEVSKKTVSSLPTKVYVGLMILGALLWLLLSSLSVLILCLLLGLTLIFLKGIKKKISKEPKNEDLDQIPDFLRPNENEKLMSWHCVPQEEGPPKPSSWDRYTARLSVLKTEGYVEHYLNEFETKCGRKPTDYEYHMHFWNELYDFFLRHEKIEEWPELKEYELSCREAYRAKIGFTNLADEETWKAEVADQKKLAELEYDDKKGKSGGELQWALWRRKQDNRSSAEYMDDLLENSKSLTLKRETCNLSDAEYLESLTELEPSIAYLDHEECRRMEDRIIDTIPEEATVKFLRIKKDATNYFFDIEKDDTH